LKTFATSTRVLILGIWLALVNFQYCQSKAPWTSPPGYDFNQPQKWILNKHLHEISGIAISAGRPNLLYAIQDEEGKLFSFQPGEEKYDSYKFGKKGDFEDLGILKDSCFVILRSDGVLTIFPKDSIGNSSGWQPTPVEGLLPAGEFEGMFADGDSLVVMCKNCESDTRKEVTLFSFKLGTNGSLVRSAQWVINVADVPMTSINKKIKFHPSCLAKNPVSGDWFVVSAVNHVLLVLDSKWQLKNNYPLDPALFKQPEGIAFRPSGDLYISNEGQESSADLLLFKYLPGN